MAIEESEETKFTPFPSLASTLPPCAFVEIECEANMKRNSVVDIIVLNFDLIILFVNCLTQLFKRLEKYFGDAHIRVVLSFMGGKYEQEFTNS